MAMDMNEAAAQAQSPEQAPEQGGDVEKLIQGVGMGLQKLSEVLPPEIAGKVGELMSQFQSILSGEEEPSEEEGMPQGQVDAMSGGRGQAVM